MKKGIHPDYQPTEIKCACGEVIATSSTKQNMRVWQIRQSKNKAVREEHRLIFCHFVSGGGKNG